MGRNTLTAIASSLDCRCASDSGDWSSKMTLTDLDVIHIADIQAQGRLTGTSTATYPGHEAPLVAPCGPSMKYIMIHNIRTLISKSVMQTSAGRMIFFTGLIGFALTTIDGVLHINPGMAKALEATLPAIMQQRLLVVGTLLLFLSAYLARRREQDGDKAFLDQLLEFWEFRPLREWRLSCRLFEAAHLALIAVMFHRALFL